MTLERRDPTGAENAASVAGTATAEDTRGAVAEETKIIEKAPRYLQEMPKRPPPDRDDDWFVLLDVTPRESSYKPPGSVKIRPGLLFKTLALLCFISVLARQCTESVPRCLC